MPSYRYRFHEVSALRALMHAARSLRENGDDMDAEPYHGGDKALAELPTVTKKSYLLRNLEGNTKIQKCIQKVRFWRHTEPNVTAINFRP